MYEFLPVLKFRFFIFYSNMNMGPGEKSYMIIVILVI